MTARRRPSVVGARRASVPAAIALALVLVGCSTGDGTDLDARVPASTRPPATDVTTAASAVVPADATEDGDPGTTTPVLPAEPSATSAPSPEATPPPEPVPETGVPGLDSDDAFCNAWSRFGGSFQVVAVAAAFGDGEPESVATFEVLASQTVGRAFVDLATEWPDELEAEREAALGAVWQPFADRLASAETALVATGATSAQLDDIERAWVAALERRDPTSPEVAVELSDELWAVAEAAVPAHLDQVGSWFDDTSLITDVPTPLTDAYLASVCPDQGTLAGQDADG